MPRARNIKPGLYKNADLAECSVWARYLFPGLWMLADREGRLKDRPKEIKGELLPYDSQDVEPLLAELASKVDEQGVPFIVRYQNSDGRFIQISKFKEHQSPHYSEKASVIKPPETLENRSINEQSSVITSQSMTDVLPDKTRKKGAIKRGSQPPDSLIPDSLIPDSPVVRSLPHAESDARATRLPHHWRPSFDLSDWAEAEKPGINFEAALTKFRDHYCGKIEKRDDWDGVFRNWIRNERLPNGADEPIDYAKITGGGR